MMAKKSRSTRQRSAPQRTCIACRAQEGKRALVRIVRGVDGVVVDATGKLAGRGAYIHPTHACWESALATGAIQRALRTSLTPEERDRLQRFGDALPVDADGDSPAGAGRPD